MNRTLLHYRRVVPTPHNKDHDGLSDRNTEPAVHPLAGSLTNGSMHTMKLAVKEEHNHTGT